MKFQIIFSLHASWADKWHDYSCLLFITFFSKHCVLLNARITSNIWEAHGTWYIISSLIVGNCDVTYITQCSIYVFITKYMMNLISATILTFVFNRYGPVTSVRTLPEKFCAFVNFKTKEAAGKAMQCLQVRLHVQNPS